MSLKVWLPLTKDLRQQGIGTTIATNEGATYNNTGGKLGGCYSFNGSSNRIDLTYTAAGLTEYSVALWICPTSTTIVGCPFAIEDQDGWWQCTFFNNTLNVRDTATGITGTRKSYALGNFVANEWVHIVLTYSIGTVKIYKDGELLSTNTTGGTKMNSYTGTHSKVGGSYATSGNYYYGGKINDFRIYDHCLSPMEVEELAKGLVLHYNFSDDNLESTTNLVTREDGLSDTCYNGATSKYGYGTNTDMYKTVDIFQNRKSTKVYMGTAGLSAYPYVYFDAFNAAGTAIQTLSFDYYSTLQNTLIPYSYNGTYNFSYTTNKTSGSANNVSSIIIPVEVGKWNHITITAQKADTTNTSRGIGYIRIGSASHTSTTTNYWLFSSVQVEAKNHATGYAGIGGTRTSTIVYDNSGFYNNGTISGALTIASDTPKYQASIYMPTAATISHSCCLDNTSQEWSCAAWVKPDAAGNYQNLNNFNESNRLYHGTYPLLYLNSGTNDYYNYGNLALPANQWSHIVFVFKNSTGTKLIYVNGENRTNTGGPNKTSTPKGIPDTVIIGGSYAGYMCDYREYATALSADDVLELYSQGHNNS